MSGAGVWNIGVFVSHNGILCKPALSDWLSPWVRKLSLAFQGVCSNGSFYMPSFNCLTGSPICSLSLSLSFTGSPNYVSVCLIFVILYLYLFFFLSCQALAMGNVKNWSVNGHLHRHTRTQNTSPIILRVYCVHLLCTVLLEQASDFMWSHYCKLAMCTHHPRITISRITPLSNIVHAQRGTTELRVKGAGENGTPRMR